MTNEAERHKVGIGAGFRLGLSSRAQVLAPVMLGFGLLAAVLSQPAPADQARPNPLSRSEPADTPEQVSDEIAYPKNAPLVFASIALPDPFVAPSLQTPPRTETIAETTSPLNAPAIRPLRPTIEPPSVEAPSRDDLRSPSVNQPEISRPEQPTVTPLHRTIRPGRMDTRRERLLQKLEAGEAGALTLNWPARRADRERLRAYLRRCAGWEVLVSDGTVLWGADEDAGTAWALTAAHSGYMRVLDGGAARGTAEDVARIRQRHGVTGGQPVAVVLRHLDARLIGGLIALVGAEAIETEPVSGFYAIKDGRVLLTDIKIGGSTVAGDIELEG